MSLTRDQWSQVERLFEEAQQQPVGQRLAWLAHKAGRRVDGAVIDEVKALLITAGTEASDLEIVLASPESGAHHDLKSAAGETLGPWRLLRLIGRGGMGEVYQAERADGAYEQAVAVKLIKRGVDTDAVLHRFLRERRILGSFNHPNIARLYDAGATPDGRPYLVMELVNGQPISDWCATRQLGLRPILELMMAICEAVHAAHRQQVVHRDLKPSNVLVDEDGTVKLLDFGIAKLFGENEGEATETLMGATLATPRYAAPEQLLGQAVTPASDVFSLGMMLFELLTGTLPPWRRSTLLAFAKAQQAKTVLRPSAALMSAESTLFPDEATRRQRARELAGDLDRIVLKAIDEDPLRRYAGAAPFAEDLGRFLDGRPVTAQADSWLYVARKFVRRNWLPVSAAAAVMLALMIGLGAALFQASLARQRAAELRAVVEFQSTMLAHVDVQQLGSAWVQRLRSQIADQLRQDPAATPPGAQDGLDRLLPMARPADVARDTLSGYLLDPARAEVGRRFKGDPAVAGPLHDSLGRSYADLGLYAAAIEEFRAAAAAQRKVLGPASPETLESLLRLAMAQRDGGDFAGASASIQAVMEVAQGPTSRFTLQAQDLEASVLSQSGKYDTALKIEQQILPQMRRQFGSDAPQTLQAESHLGEILFDLDRYAEAEELDQRVLSIRRRDLGPEHPDTMQAMVALSKTLEGLDKYSESRDLIQEYLKLAQHVQAADDPRTLSAELQLANALADLHDFAGADRLEQHVLERYTLQFGADNPRTVTVMFYHGQTLLEMGDYEGARRLLEKVLAWDRRSLDPSNPQILQTMELLARVMRKLDRLEEALQLAQTAYDGVLSQRGPDNDSTLITECTLADIQFGLHHLRPARTLAEQTLQINQRLFGPDDETTILAASTLAGVNAAEGNYAEAVRLTQLALQGEEDTLASDDPELLTTRNTLERYRQLAQKPPPNSAKAGAERGHHR